MSGGQICWGCGFDFADDEREITDLERRTSDETFWTDLSEAQRVMRRIGELRSRIELWGSIKRQSDDLGALAELAGDDKAMLAEISGELLGVESQLDHLEVELSFTGEYDDSNAILMVHSGEGGVDAQDWAEMVVRMYVKWADRRGLQAELLDSTPGEEAGIKNATLEIRGPHAYGYTRSEGG